jgi:CheY-like chemotaxis protein
MGQPAVFIYYNHRDEVEKEELLKHLAPINQDGAITFWRDDNFVSDEERQARFAELLGQVRVVVIILTVNFLDSDAVVHPDVTGQLLQWHQDGGVLFPVLARACAWRTVGWLRSLSVYPRHGVPVWESGGRRVDDNMAAIAAGIMEIVTSHPDWEQNAPAAAPPPKKSPRPAAKPTPPVDPDRSGPWRVLSVDDEPGWQRRLTRILSEVDCQVVTADSYEQAVTLLKRAEFDLVTVDLNLDKSTNYADGMELMTRIREMFGVHMPIIVISGTGGLEEQRRSFKEYYVYDFIQKAQLDFEELQEMVLAAMESTQHGVEQGMPHLAE